MKTLSQQELAFFLSIKGINGKDYIVTIPTKSQYIFEKSKTFDFYREFTEIINRTKNYVWFWDNYADSELLKYLDCHPDLALISEIKILCNDNNRTTKYIQDLKLAIEKFKLQYPLINIEARSSKNSHDRFILFDNERWVLGPSIKDAGKSICTMMQFKEDEAQKLYDIFNTEWSKAALIS